MTNENEYERAKIFFNKELKVHVKTSSGYFYNGLITEISDKFIIIQDFVIGNKLILFSEIEKEIEIFKEASK